MWVAAKVVRPADKTLAMGGSQGGHNIEIKLRDRSLTTPLA